MTRSREGRARIAGVALGALAMAGPPAYAQVWVPCGVEAPDSVAIPFALSHDRIVVSGHLRIGDEQEAVDVWVDPGNPDLWVSGGLSTYVAERRLGLADVTLVLDRLCLPLARARSPRVTGDEGVGPGLPADLNLPSTLLKEYDVIIDYGRRVLTLAVPGKVAFRGVRTPAVVNESNGLVVFDVEVFGQPLALGLDPGTPVSFISEEVASEVFRRNRQWPRRVGAVGRANLWGTPDETAWVLTAMPPVTMGVFDIPTHPAVVLQASGVQWLESRAGVRLDGLLGADALLDLRLGIDFANKALYWERLPRNSGLPEGAVGVTLGLDDGGNWVILAVHGGGGDEGYGGLRSGDVLAAVDGVATAGRSMGEVWELLLGDPGEKRSLAVDRRDESIVVVVVILPVLPRDVS